MMHESQRFHSTNRAQNSKIGPFWNPIVILTMIAVFGVGCESGSTPPKGRESAKEVLAPRTGAGVAGGGGAPDASEAPASIDKTWSIVLVSFVADPSLRGNDDPAQVALSNVHDVGLRDAYLEQRGRASVVAYGHYASPEAPEARADLARIRATKVDGTMPFADAFLAAPPEHAVFGANSELDLRNARKLHGGKRAAYSLQVAVYSRTDRKAPTDEELREFRSSAEQAAATLRREGELAFYYHGTNSSSVTIGIFSPQDIDAKKGVNPALRAARARHPEHLVNGAGVRERVKGAVSGGEPVYRMQAPMLIEIP